MATSGYIDPNWPNPHGSGDASIIIYGYVPSFPLAIVAIVLFIILLIAHTTRIVQYRNWTFIPVMVACVLEIIGYVFRALSGKVDPYRISFFVGQYFCITVAPVFIAASIYVYLTQIALFAKSNKLDMGMMKVVTPKVMLWVFVTADVVCTLLQVTGAALIGSKTSNHEDPTMPNHILLAGLFAQAFAFCIFLILLSSLVWSLARAYPATYSGRSNNSPGISIRPYMYALCIIGVLIMLRTVFRLVETAQGVFGYLSSHEAFFGSLEFAPVVIATALLAIWSPGRLLVHDSSSRRAKVNGEIA